MNSFFSQAITYMNQVAEQYEEKKPWRTRILNGIIFTDFAVCPIASPNEFHIFIRTMQYFLSHANDILFNFMLEFFQNLNTRPFPLLFFKASVQTHKKIYNRKLSRNANNVLITLTTHLLQFKIHKITGTDCTIKTIHLPQFIHYDHKLHCPPRV